MGMMKHEYHEEICADSELEEMGSYYTAQELERLNYEAAVLIGRVEENGHGITRLNESISVDSSQETAKEAV